jgi:hypothetical protein
MNFDAVEGNDLGTSAAIACNVAVDTRDDTAYKAIADVEADKWFRQPGIEKPW